MSWRFCSQRCWSRWARRPGAEFNLATGWWRMPGRRARARPGWGRRPATSAGRQRASLCGATAAAAHRRHAGRARQAGRPRVGHQHRVAVRFRQRSQRQAVARAHLGRPGARNRRGLAAGAAAHGHVRRQHAGSAGAWHLDRRQRRRGAGPGPGRRLRLRPDDARAAAPNTAQAPGAPGWQDALKRELAHCATQGFFERPSCSWAARNKYCAPNRAWGTMAECPARPQ